MTIKKLKLKLMNKMLEIKVQCLTKREFEILMLLMEDYKK